MGKSLLPPDVARYAAEVTARETSVQRRLREETAQMPHARMQISPDQAAFLRLLATMLGARKTIEIGTFTGYSALAVALALPAGGKVIACDVSREWTDIARRYWAEASVAGRIDLRLAPAKETLNLLLQEGGAESFDLAFIDADKLGYDEYYELCLRLVRPGGMIALDNMLWSGEVAKPDIKDEETRALHTLNLKIVADERVDCSLLTIGDGLMLARRR